MRHDLLLPCAFAAVVELLLLAATSRAEPSLQIEQLTLGPRHHFFGYIGHVQTIPWNSSGRYLVALESEFQDRLPGANDAANIVLIDTQRNNELQVVDQTRGWNLQQGTMLYWNPTAAETQFFFNDRDPATGKVFCVLYDLAAGEQGKRIKEFRFDDTPIGNGGVNQRGGSFAAINYGRLARLRPVTGYREAFDWTIGVRHPDDDGVFVVNVESGQKRLLVSFTELAAGLRPMRPDVDQKSLFINHTLWNRDGDRLFFFVRGDFDDRQERINQPYVIRSDGSGLTPLKVHIGGHPEWECGPRMIGAVDGHQVIFDTQRQEIVERLGDKSIFPSPEGDIALSPDGRWLVNGYRQGSENYYAFFRRDDGLVLRSRGFNVRGWTSGDLRIDGAPCWNRQSDAIVVTALSDDPEPTRQMFLIRIVP